MYTFADLEKAISERVGLRLGETILHSYIRDHKKHNWRTCSCSFCETKRQATADIGNGVYRSLVREASEEYYDSGKYIRIICEDTFRPMFKDIETKEEFTLVEANRRALKKKYRAKMAHQESMC